MSVRYIGEVGQNFGAVSASNITFTSARTMPVGSLVVFAVRGGGLQTITSVSDTQGNTWTKLANTTTTNTCNVWYSVLTTAFNTSTVVTANYAGASANRIIGAWGFDGLTRPATANAIASGGTAITTLSPANLTVPQYGSLVFSAVSVNQLATYTAPSGFTALSVSSSAGSLQGAYLIRSSMDSVATTWSWNLAGSGGVVSGTFTPDGGDMFGVL